MTSCTIVISHFHSENFLRAAIRQIRKFKHPEIRQQICVCDQSSEECFDELVAEYGNSEDVDIIHTKPLYSGYGIDQILRSDYIETEYIAQIHADVLAIHQNWLYLPIKLIEEYNLSFVGQLQFINNNLASIYPPQKFFAMAQCFNVARKETYEEMSKEAGFTRFHNRIDSGLEFNNSDWADWAQGDYFKRGSDDDVVAFHWQDKYKKENKFGLAISGYIEPSYGRIIDGLVFHFCSCREAQGVINQMPEKYRQFTRRINENYDDNLINEMVELAQANKPGNAEILVRNYWDGRNKVASPPNEEINKRIEELKK